MMPSEPLDESRKADSHGVSPGVAEANRDAKSQQYRDRSSLRISMRLVGSGMELATYTLLLGAAGYWIDGQRHHAKPYIGMVGALVGFTLGMYRLIVLATRQR